VEQRTQEGGCQLERPTEANRVQFPTAGKSAADKRNGETHRYTLDVGGSDVWTRRMLTTLEEGVKEDDGTA